MRISPRSSAKLAEDLIFARQPDALARLIAAFEGVNASDERAGSDSRHAARGTHPLAHPAPQTGARIEEDIDALMAERLRAAGVSGDGPIPNADSRRAVDVLNNVLLPAMKEVGEKFGTGELILPFVLQSAEVMKRAVTRRSAIWTARKARPKASSCWPRSTATCMTSARIWSKTILANNGFTVIDLGKQVPVGTIVEKAEEEKADAIGLSALLVSTSKADAAGNPGTAPRGDAHSRC